MSCCGGRSRGSVSLPHAGSASTSSSPSRARASLAVFRYEGDKPLTVIGRVTGAKYRFAPGAEVAVDIQDRSSVRQVPRLRELRLV